MAARTPPSTRLAWRTSTRSGQLGQCVEVARLPRMVAVRDSKDPGERAIIVSVRRWRSFIERVKLGHHDRRRDGRRDTVRRGGGR
jgi:hypothetical protein